MLRDDVVTSDAPQVAFSMNVPHRRTAPPVLDPSMVSGASRGFEGLLINRGRSPEKVRVPVSAAHRRMLAAAHLAQSSPLHVGIAESIDQIEAANRLICQRYAWRGYSLEAFDSRSSASRRNGSCHEITFFAAERGTTLGTLTLRLDGPEGLSAEATHGQTMRDVRTEERRLGELTRLAVAESVDSRVVLASLFGLVYAVGRLVHGVTDVFIEVNPRHVAFYSRALGFVVIGEERFCERVRAPSVLLHLNVEILDEQLGFADVAAQAAGEPEVLYGT